jgi:hypothetical protein
MKKLVKLILVLSVAAFTVNTIQAQTRFGAKASFNFYNMTVKDNNDDKLDTKMVPGFNIGAFAEIPLVPEFYIKPELLFAQKGYKYEVLGKDVKTKLSYIEVPVTFMYKGELSGGSVFLGFGPYFAFGIGGKAKNGSTEDVKFKNDISLIEASQNVYFKPLDVGGKFYAGYEFGNGFSFAIESSLGLVNISPKIAGNDNGTAKNVGFGLALGYKF